MAAPNLISTRRLSGSVRMRLQVVFARAWEALAETYRDQAVEFVRRLRGRLSFDEALERYFREIGVPAAMVDTVRARALIAMAELAEEEGEPELADNTAWGALRPDQLGQEGEQGAFLARDLHHAAGMAARLLAEPGEDLGLPDPDPDEVVVDVVGDPDLLACHASIMARDQRRWSRWWPGRRLLECPRADIAQW